MKRLPSLPIGGGGRNHRGLDERLGDFPSPRHIADEHRHDEQGSSPRLGSVSRGAVTGFTGHSGALAIELLVVFGVQMAIHVHSHFGEGPLARPE